ncbi:selenium cofactor biosynthesis protein YqeC [Serratia fonticola]|uniref:selenium cofactor biosynthesis protein YqeC n=1 Tax=Serratia fonticola TaxID=47917 RepID=UPI00192B133B|nr:selenium cofactor biosynthesis protein YqeC [Serratia fonticola]MBL5905615.1 putative selenium-dependent hydroxylase accessory protein YqeC [Serratia fonticola]
MTPSFRELFSEEYHRLEQGQPLLIALIGAGGKTSTLHWLAQAFYHQGKRVLFTTTTKMYLPTAANYHHLLIGQPPTTSSTPAITACFSHYQPQDNKVIGLPPEQIDEIKQHGAFDVILVEADGSRGLPLKAPARHEPCIPSRSDCVIALTGGQVIDRPADPQQIHRWAIFSALTGVGAGEVLDHRVFDTLIAHSDGMFKGTPPQARRVWLINQASHCDNQPAARWQPLLRPELALSAIWFGAVQEPPAIHHLIRRLTR